MNKQRNFIDKYIFSTILSIYVMLFIFFIISNIFPSLFSKISYQNKKQELGILINEAIKLSINKDYYRALQIFDEVIKKMPQLPESYVNKAVTLKTIHNYAEALNNLNLALKYKISDSANVFLNYKDIYLELGDTNKAKFYLVKAVEASDNEIEKYMISGNFYFNLRILDSSFFYYQKALKERFIPSNYIHDSVRFYMGDNEIINFFKTNFDTTSFVLNLNFDRGLSENYNKIGVVLALQNKYKDALNYFYKAVNVWKEFKDANDNIRFIYEHRKNY